VSETDEISDGYHTFGELYDHRAALFIALMLSHPGISWFSDKHDDGSVFEGFFIAGMHLPTGQISYHMRVEPWRRLLEGQVLDKIPHPQKAPRWDGHNSTDVIERLKQWIEAL
jgi:hypothetical protein